MLSDTDQTYCYTHQSSHKTASQKCCSDTDQTYCYTHQSSHKTASQNAAQTQTKLTATHISLHTRQHPKMLLRHRPNLLLHTSVFTQDSINKCCSDTDQTYCYTHQSSHKTASKNAAQTQTKLTATHISLHTRQHPKMLSDTDQTYCYTHQSSHKTASQNAAQTQTKLTATHISLHTRQHPKMLSDTDQTYCYTHQSSHKTASLNAAQTQTKLTATHKTASKNAVRHRPNLLLHTSVFTQDSIQKCCQTQTKLSYCSRIISNAHKRLQLTRWVAEC